jgi:hypothetical protein
MSHSFKSHSLKFLLLLLLCCFAGALPSRANEITLPSIHFKALGSAPFLLPVNASSGLAINYQVVAGGSVASVSANQVTLSGQKGSVTIKASQAGGGIWPAAEDRYLTFVVDDTPQWKKVFCWHRQISRTSGRWHDLDLGKQLFSQLGNKHTDSQEKTFANGERLRLG